MLYCIILALSSSAVLKRVQGGLVYRFFRGIHGRVRIGMCFCGKLIETINSKNMFPKYFGGILMSKLRNDSFIFLTQKYMFIHSNLVLITTWM